MEIGGLGAPGGDWGIRCSWWRLGNQVLLVVELGKFYWCTVKSGAPSDHACQSLTSFFHYPGGIYGKFYWCTVKSRTPGDHACQSLNP